MVKSISLNEDEGVDLSTYNYPSSTYADSKWVITSPDNGATIFKFLDFQLSFGASLTIGTGSNFSYHAYLFKIGSTGIHIHINDTLVVKESSFWIWFQANDPTGSVVRDTTVDVGLGGSEDLQFEEGSPSVNGLKFHVKNVDFGMNVCYYKPHIIFSMFDPHQTRNFIFLDI